MDVEYHIREALPTEHHALGQLMVRVYADLDGFPGPDDHPAYYRLLADVGVLARKPAVSLWVAVDVAGKVGAGLVYYADLSCYGTHSGITRIKDASGFRLLAGDPACRGQGLAKRLVQACVERARAHGHRQLLIHSTRAMQVAWGMYERMGFERMEEIDFRQDELEVFGFRLAL